MPCGVCVRASWEGQCVLMAGLLCPPGMVLVRSENGQLLMIPQQALAQMQAQAHAQAQPQSTMAPRPATPTSAPPVQISTVQVSACPCDGWPPGLGLPCLLPNATHTWEAMRQGVSCVSGSHHQWGWEGADLRAPPGTGPFPPGRARFCNQCSA